MPDHPVVAVLSTGRCGTQWLAAGLAELYPGIDVAHEPIGPLYSPRRYFRRYADPDAILEVEPVADHLQAVEEARRPYVETGWPLFPALPLMADRFRGRLRVLHLTRHPIPSALSHAVHKSYAGSPRRDAYTRLATLGPRDPGVFPSEAPETWESLSPYEKCLFWWTQVHRFGLELRRRMADLPLLRIKSESLLGGDRESLHQMVTFLGLPWNERWTELTGRRVDRWHHHTDEVIDPREIQRHPETLELAQALGYVMTDVDPVALAKRYAGAPNLGLDRIGRYEAATARGVR